MENDDIFSLVDDYKIVYSIQTICAITFYYFFKFSCPREKMLYKIIQSANKNVLKFSIHDMLLKFVVQL